MAAPSQNTRGRWRLHQAGAAGGSIPGEGTPYFTSSDLTNFTLDSHRVLDLQLWRRRLCGFHGERSWTEAPAASAAALLLQTAFYQYTRIGGHFWHLQFPSIIDEASYSFNFFLVRHSGAAQRSDLACFQPDMLSRMCIPVSSQQTAFPRHHPQQLFRLTDGNKGREYTCSC